MKANELDALDKRLIRVLIKEGRLPSGNIAERLDITPPTVRSRIEALVSSGVMRVAGLLNPFKLKDVTLALVCISLERHQELDAKIEAISQLPQVHWVVAVTGQYDIIAEIILTRGMPDLYQFLTEELPRLGGVRSSESFLVMKAKRKWILLPDENEIIK
ncbi:MAG: Lrp/AsnC family transcriptional regulator [Deltaproteobacteria bacterium]|nr:Lrp/AsnC family transcriptional regulator [Deltaproteobacteria bacterium]MBW2015364.1 Lrp/AsnC family transcriptional regulator [Deltaproteobacteria bacterium]MBW2129059.1 Lrp/AsnC family transcriptional regulator [Deltaproteobacteria bacterium]MBW2303058.1 Lrp/AsnC family transcriptional regulator [Deltaproteobacteria bacterium]